MRTALLGFVVVAAATLIPMFALAWGGGCGGFCGSPGPDYNPGVILEANPSTIQAGQSTVITFRAPLAFTSVVSDPEPDVSENCTADFPYTEIPDESWGYPWGTMGTYTDYPTANKTYTVTCRLFQSESASGVTYRYETQSVTVTVTPAAGADLTAGSVSPTQVTYGAAATLSASIFNHGGTATPGGFTNLFQRATDDLGNGVVDIGTYQRTTALPASQNFAATLSYNFPSIGTWYVRACADKSSATNPGTVTESSETNNCGAWTAIDVRAQCNDGQDNNGAGGTDYPADPSCTSVTDTSEDGVVPSVSCSPSPASISVPGNVTYTAVGGGGAGAPFTWTPSSGSTVCAPNPGNPTTCTLSTPGSHSMTVRATGGGNPTAICSPRVTAGCAGPISVSLTANGQSDNARVNVGSPVTLAWDISGVNAPTTCSLTSVGDVTPSGVCSVSNNQSVGPVNTQTVYTLSCGSVSDSVIVNVSSGLIEF